MSTSLYWSPIPKDPKEASLYSLKWVMAKKFGQYDGSVGEDLGRVDADLIPFLEGIAATNGDMSEDAKELIDAIRKHGEVQLTIHS